MLLSSTDIVYSIVRRHFASWNVLICILSLYRIYIVSALDVFATIALPRGYLDVIAVMIKVSS